MLQWRANEMHIFFSTLMAVSVVPTVAFALAGWKVVAWAYFIPTFGVASVFLGARLWYRHRFFQTASRVLGISVNFLHPVDVRVDRYENWCRDRGIVPLNDRAEPGTSGTTHQTN